jgi:hypothetical protein
MIKSYSKFIAFLIILASTSITANADEKNKSNDVNNNAETTNVDLETSDAEENRLLELEFLRYQKEAETVAAPCLVLPDCLG